MSSSTDQLEENLSQATLDGAQDGELNKEVAERVEDGASEEQSNDKPSRGPESCSQDDDEYNMQHSKRGVAIVINNPKYEESRDVTATDTDSEALVNAFQAVGFNSSDILKKESLSIAEIKKLLEKVAEEDHTDSDCFALAMISRGFNEYIYASDGPVTLDTLLSPFRAERCPSLVGKPKIFFIQVCQEGAQEEFRPEVRLYREPDFLIVYSSSYVFLHHPRQSGYYTWRDSKKGSFFVQNLLETLTTSGKGLELMHVLHRVNRAVAHCFEQECEKINLEQHVITQNPCDVTIPTLSKQHNYTSARRMSVETDGEIKGLAAGRARTFSQRSDSLHGKKQTPCVVSTLTKQLYFK